MSANREAAFALARRKFMAGKRLEMGALADELGVSRMTLNRWVGSRDKLLADVNWSLARPTLDRYRFAGHETGVELVATTLQQFIAAVRDAPFMRKFLQQEGEIALRVLTTRDGDNQRNFIEYVRSMLAEELPGRQFELPLEDLAYLVVRIAESFCYVDLITGDESDPTKVGAGIRLLLG